MVSASAKPNSRHASIVCTGRHFPKIQAANAMKPRPAAMLRVNRDDCPIERYAPPIPASAPDNNTPEYLMSDTLTPAASAASGFSPTDLRRKPNGVRFKTYQLSGTRSAAITIGVYGINCSLGSCGVDPEDRKNAPLRNPGTPNIRMLIAVPLT